MTAAVICSVIMVFKKLSYKLSKVSFTWEGCWHAPSMFQPKGCQPCSATAIIKDDPQGHPHPDRTALSRMMACAYPKLRVKSEEYKERKGRL